MAILITQARFTQEGSKGTTATSENRVKAASQLVAKAGGTLIAYYLTSGDYDLLLIFQASSYEETVPALATAAAEIGVADLKTVTVLTSGGMKRAVVDTRSAAADHRPTGAGVADLPSTEPTADLHTPDPQHEDTTGEVQADAEAATRILDAHKKAVSDIAAGRLAPYYLVPPPTAAPSKTTPALPADSKDAAKKNLQASRKSRERPGEPMKMVTRLVSFGGKRPGTMAPLIVPPPSRSQPQISGGVLAAALAARCQASATLCQCPGASG